MGNKAALGRNYGIDLLRIVSMFMVVVLHALGRGGILKGLEGNEIKEALAYTLEAFCICAVNLYAITTGFVCIKSKHKSERIISLWIEVFFYSVAITVLAKIFGADIGYGVLLYSFFPVLSNRHWYFSCYFCLFFLIPFINKALLGASKKDRCSLSIILIALLGFAAVASDFIFGTSIFGVDSGYNVLWLIALYIIGACIRLSEDKILSLSKPLMLLGYLLCSVATSVLRYALGKIEFFAKNKGIVFGYNSPTVLIGSICLFIFFASLGIKRFKGVIGFLAPAAFGVYIIHMTYPVWEFIIKDMLVPALDKPVCIVLLLALASAAAIFIVCTAIDLVRIRLFSLLKVDLLAKKIADKADLLLDKITKKFLEN